MRHVPCQPYKHRLSPWDSVWGGAQLAETLAHQCNRVQPAQCRGHHKRGPTVAAAAGLAAAPAQGQRLTQGGSQAARVAAAAHLSPTLRWPRHSTSRQSGSEQRVGAGALSAILDAVLLSGGLLDCSLCRVSQFQRPRRAYQWVPSHVTAAPRPPAAAAVSCPAHVLPVTRSAPSSPSSLATHARQRRGTRASWPMAFPTRLGTRDSRK